MSEQNYKKVGYLAHKWGHVVAPLGVSVLLVAGRSLVVADPRSSHVSGDA